MAMFERGQKVKVVDGCSPYYGLIGTMIKEGDGYFGVGYHVEFNPDGLDLQDTWLFQEFQLAPSD
jgi:hypothetical protein